MMLLIILIPLDEVLAISPILDLSERNAPKLKRSERQTTTEAQTETIMEKVVKRVLNVCTSVFLPKKAIVTNNTKIAAGKRI